MPPAQKYHIDLLEDRVVPCKLAVGSCEFGGLDTHFYDEDKAYRKLLIWRELNRAWLTKSAYPQEEGWVSEHIFDPERPESYEKHHVLFGHDITEGTRLVIENGWIFTKESFDDFWTMNSGYEVAGGIKNGQVLRYYEFLGALEEFGGRLEYTEGIKPIARLRWKELNISFPQQADVREIPETRPKPKGILSRIRSSFRG